MAYDKQTWDTTSYVNPTRMNHMEDGIKGNSDAIVDINEALGNTSISTIGDGSVTGAISSLNSNLTNSFKILEMGESAQFQFTTSVSEVNITVTFPAHNNCKVFAMLCGGGGYVGASFKLTSQTNSSATFKVYTTQVVPATYTFTITYIVVGV